MRMLNPRCLRLALIGCALSVGCASGCEPRPGAGPAGEITSRTDRAGAAWRRSEPGARQAEEPEMAQRRQAMVQEQLAARDIHDPRVLAAMAKVPRHAFVDEMQQDDAYSDMPLPIESGQTISQPYIVALMSELADVQAGEKVLEVGTGSGYQAAVLAELGARVYSIEIDERLARTARARLARLGYQVEVRHGDGYAGWPEQAPFDAVLITAAPPHVPDPLVAQLALDGHLVVPLGDRAQDLWVLTRTAKGVERKNVLPVRFVPMTGTVREAH